VKGNKKEQIVLDSYALLALMKNEPGADTVEEKIKSALTGDCKLSMNVINLGEVIYNLIREEGAEFAAQREAVIFQLPIEFMSSDWGVTRIAAEIKASIPIAYADCFAIATAQKFNATIITGDPEFKQVEDHIKILWLPTK
jgi:predicted nucleic acid-binding protein